jgi:hypothetical protein
MKIVFVPGSIDIDNNVLAPEPSRKNIPSWYKNIPGDEETMNLKKCIPFLDSISHGYIQKTWADIHVKADGNNVLFSQSSGVPIFLNRENASLPIEKDFYNVEFIWQRPWATILPKGFSALIVHPLNRIDLPFYTLSGVVDFDKSIHGNIGNIPFYIKKGFTGIIPAGTPMFQIIPIKREDWVSEKAEYNDLFWKEKINEKLGVSNFYKKKIWQKKSFD